MTNSRLLIQNINDAVTPNGISVKGRLKQRCLVLSNRVLLQAKENDFVAITDNCPNEFIDYLKKLLNLSNLQLLKYVIEENLNTSTIFNDILRNNEFKDCLISQPNLIPYMKSSDFYDAAMRAGISVPKEEIRASKATEFLKDKAIFSKNCQNLKINVPEYFETKKENLTKTVISLIAQGQKSLFIRPTQSGGGVGNMALENEGGRYSIKHTNNEIEFFKTLSDLKDTLDDIANKSNWKSYIITSILSRYASPGTFFFVDEKKVHIFGHTLQRLIHNNNFQGFQYPIEDAKITKYFPYVESAIEELAKYWIKLGFKGYGNIDWIVTTEGQCYLVEFNPRQTSVFSPLIFINRIINSSDIDKSFDLSHTTVLTNDYVTPNQKKSFNEVIAILKNKNLHFGQKTANQGIIITIPPLPNSQLSSFGIMAVANDLSTVEFIYNNAMIELTR